MASFIMAGRFQAIAFASLFVLLSPFVPPFILVGGAAVALVTLRQGINQGIIVMLSASVVLAIATTIIQADFFSGFSLGLLTWFPMVILATILTRTVSWTYTLQAILLIVVGGVIIFHLSVSDPLLLWKAEAEEIVKALTQNQSLKADEIEELVISVAKWVTASFAFLVMVFLTVSLLIARYWQSVLYKPGGFGEEFRELRVGKLPAIISLLLVLIAVFSESQMMADISAVVLAIFLFQGLGLMHNLVKNLGMSHVWLIGTYILMMPFFPSSMIVIILLVSFGIIDNFSNFRNTLTTKD